MPSSFLLMKLLLGGLKSHVPMLSRHKGTGGTTTAPYCYSVWLRHLKMVHHHGLPSLPRRVLEIGPGDSLGTGLAALLSGAEAYCALDVVEHASISRDLEIFDELVTLFEAQRPLPFTPFPDLKPRLPDNQFPTELLPHLASPARAQAIRQHLARGRSNDPESMIRYVCPFEDEGVVERGWADWLFSQAVLEYAEDLDSTYAAMARWLAPGGVMSHQIDLSCHGLAETWDGHWGYSALTWRMIRGKRPFFINRSPLSHHIRALRGAGLKLVAAVPTVERTRLSRRALAADFKNLSDEDRSTRSVFIIAQKPDPASGISIE